MSKNVLIISASPRKGGNSDSLCDCFIKGAESAGHHVEKIFLYDKKINFCLGCMKCMINDGTCVQDDDMRELLEKFETSDVILFAVPVYFYTMNAIMKNFIDRCAPRYPKLINKEFYFIVTAAAGDKSVIEKALGGLRYFVNCLKDSKECGIIYGTGLAGRHDYKGSVAAYDAEIMGRKI